MNNIRTKLMTTKQFRNKVIKISDRYFKKFIMKNISKTSYIKTYGKEQYQQVRESYFSNIGDLFKSSKQPTRLLKKLLPTKKYERIRVSNLTNLFQNLVSESKQRYINVYGDLKNKELRTSIITKLTGNIKNKQYSTFLNSIYDDEDYDSYERLNSSRVEGGRLNNDVVLQILEEKLQLDPTNEKYRTMYKMFSKY